MHLQLLKKTGYPKRILLTGILILLISSPLFSQELPWYGKLRLGIATGLTAPPDMDLGPLVGLDDQSFVMRPGWNINTFIDYNIWKDLNVGFHYRYNDFFSPDQFARDFQLHGFTTNAGWAFSVGAGTIEPTLDIGVSYITITDVRNDIFSIAEGQGDDISFATFFLGTGVRATGKLSKYVDIYGEFDISLNIMQDMAIPLFSFNVGLSFSSSTLFAKDPIPIELKEIPITETIEIFPEGEIMIAQLYFFPGSSQTIPTNKKSIEKAIKSYTNILSETDYTVRLEGYAVPIDGDIPWKKLILKRIETTKELLIELGINADKIETTKGKIKPLRSIPKKEWSYLRRVDIYIIVERAVKEPENDIIEEAAPVNTQE